MVGLKVPPYSSITIKSSYDHDSAIHVPIPYILTEDYDDCGDDSFSTPLIVLHSSLYIVYCTMLT